MNDWLIRIGIAGVSGLTYFAGAIPSDMAWSGLSNLPAQTWLYFLINVCTGFVSPSLVKLASNAAVGAIKK